MGTRGTLRIYVNGELKVRQYNQWDSYPTGQFNTICEVMSSRFIVNSVASKLLNTRLATKEEMKNLCDKGHKSETTKEIWLHALLNRDIGSDLLLIMAGAPNACEVLPDWYHVFSDSEEGDDLVGEEGNYKIEFEFPLEQFVSPKRRAGEVKFRLSGEWHGAERQFDWDYIPTNEEIKAWEEEPHSD